jgi:hypothetical protein
MPSLLASQWRSLSATTRTSRILAQASPGSRSSPLGKDFG